MILMIADILMIKKNAMTLRRSVLSLFGAFLFSAAVCAQPVDAATPNPEAAISFVTTLANQAIDILRQTDENDLDKREAVFRNILTEGFDLRAIGRLILGKHWRTASEKQRDDYLNLFSEYVLRTYSSMLGGYTGESFQIGQARPVGKADIEVDSRIVSPESPPVPVEWRVRMINQKYKVIDVKVEGVSMVITKRSEFASVIKNKGFDGLLNALQPRT